MYKSELHGSSETRRSRVERKRAAETERQVKGSDKNKKKIKSAKAALNEAFKELQEKEAGEQHGWWSTGDAAASYRSSPL